MFDLGFGEIALLAIVLLIVVGPRELPRLLRTVGRGIAKLRTMSWELRSQSGIDEIIRDEGLQKDIEAVRSLSKGRVVDALVNEAMRPPKGAKATDAEPGGDDDGDGLRTAAYASEADDEAQAEADDAEPVERSGKPGPREASKRPQPAREPATQAEGRPSDDEAKRP